VPLWAVMSCRAGRAGCPPPLLVLDLGLDVVDRGRRLDLEGDRLATERLDKDLHATAEAEHEVELG
jgi:hypothetical protein